MQETLTSIHQAFLDYRQQHRKGAYPLRLRRRAVDGLTQSERFELAARLGLTAAQVSRWDEGAKRPAEHPKFFEVCRTEAQTPAPPAAARELQIEVELRGGVVLRLRGDIDADGLRMVVTALQGAGATA